MHITVEREHLAALLEKASGVAPSRPGAKFLGVIWIQASDHGSVQVMATDSKLEYVGQCPADVVATGLAGAGRHLHDLLRRLPAGPMELETDDSGHALQVRSGKRKYTLPIYDPSWYAPVSSPSGEMSMAPAGLIRDMLGHTIFAASQDALDEAFHHVHVDKPHAENGDAAFRSWAVDGHKAAVFTRPYPDEQAASSREMEQMAYGRTAFAKPHAQALLKLLPKDISLGVEWAMDNNRLYLRTGDGMHCLSAPVQSATPPDIDRVLETACGDALVNVHADLLLEALDRISVFVSETARCVSMHFNKAIGNEYMELRISSSDKGQATERVVLDGCSVDPHALDGLTMPVGAWQAVVKQLRTDFDSDWINLTFTHKNGPITHRPSNNWREHMLVMLMPMRVDTEETYYE